MTENLVIDVTVEEEEAPVETLETSLKDLSDIALALKNEVATLQQKIKQIDKLVKQDKKKKSQEPKVTKKKLSGFALPMPISDDLCRFMNKPTGSKVARTDVTKYLVKYVKDQKLEDANNHRIICPNEELSSLLSSKEGDEVTYFNLQTYINHHFKVK